MKSDHDNKETKMELQEKLDKIADVLDVDAGTLTAETRLDDVNWDSMGMLSVIALAKANGKTVAGTQVRAFETVGDIVDAAF